MVPSFNPKWNDNVWSIIAPSLGRTLSNQACLNLTILLEIFFHFCHSDVRIIAIYVLRTNLTVTVKVLLLRRWFRFFFFFSPCQMNHWHASYNLLWVTNLWHWTDRAFFPDSERHAHFVWTPCHALMHKLSLIQVSNFIILEIWVGSIAIFCVYARNDANLELGKFPTWWWALEWNVALKM